MNVLKRIGIDYNQGDKWSDEESDDECVSSELKTDTAYYRKFISGDLGPEDDWGNLDDDDAMPNGGNRNGNHTIGSGANRSAHASNGEYLNIVNTLHGALPNISNRGTNEDVSLALVINGVVSTIQALQNETPAPIDTKPFLFSQPMNTSILPNQHDESFLSNQLDQSIAEAPFISGAHSSTKIKQEQPDDIPLEKTDPQLDPPRDSRLTKNNYCKDDNKPLLPQCYNEIKPVLKPKTQFKPSLSIERERERVKKAVNVDPRLNRTATRPHLIRIAHPDAESKRISLSADKKTSTAQSSLGSSSKSTAQQLNKSHDEKSAEKTKKDTASKRISLSTYKRKRTSQSLRDSSPTPTKSPENQPKKSNDKATPKKTEEKEADCSSSDSEFSHEQFMTKYKRIKTEKSAASQSRYSTRSSSKKQKSSSARKSKSNDKKVPPIHIDLKESKVKTGSDLFPTGPTPFENVSSDDDFSMKNNTFDNGDPLSDDSLPLLFSSLDESSDDAEKPSGSSKPKSKKSEHSVEGSQSCVADQIHTEIAEMAKEIESAMLTEVSAEPQNERQQIIELQIECQMDLEPNQLVETSQVSENIIENSCQMDVEPSQIVETNEITENIEISGQMDVELPNPLVETSEISENIIENSCQVDVEPNQPVETNKVPENNENNCQMDVEVSKNNDDISSEVPDGIEKILMGMDNANESETEETPQQKQAAIESIISMLAGSECSDSEQGIEAITQRPTEVQKNHPNEENLTNVNEGENGLQVVDTQEDGFAIDDVPTDVTITSMANATNSFESLRMDESDHEKTTIASETEDLDSTASAVNEVTKEIDVQSKERTPEPLPIAADKRKTYKINLNLSPKLMLKRLAIDMTEYAVCPKVDSKPLPNKPTSDNKTSDTQLRRSKRRTVRLLNQTL